jgi:hypothetical protein
MGITGPRPLDPAGFAAHEYAVLLLRLKNGEECRVAFRLAHYTQPVTESLPVLDHTGTEGDDHR